MVKVDNDFQSAFVRLISIRLKEKSYKTMITPYMIYGIDYQPMMKQHMQKRKRKKSIADMIMLKQIYNKSRKERIINDLKLESIDCKTTELGQSNQGLDTFIIHLHIVLKFNYNAIFVQWGENIVKLEPQGDMHQCLGHLHGRITNNQLYGAIRLIFIIGLIIII